MRNVFSLGQITVVVAPKPLHYKRFNHVVRAKESSSDHEPYAVHISAASVIYRFTMNMSLFNNLRAPQMYLISSCSVRIWSYNARVTVMTMVGVLGVRQ